MEQFINQAKAFLGIFESVLPKKEQEEALAAADEMYTELRKVVERRKINVRQMIYACVAILTAVLGIANEEASKMKDNE
jgi:cytochrome P450